MTKKSFPGRLAALSFLAANLACVTPAFAHHLMGGKLPSTFGEGILSGLGHPVIGVDHLAFLIAVGLAVGIGGLSLLLPLVFVGASAIGVALHVQAVDLPAAELIVAASVVLAGILLARGSEIPGAVWGVIFAVAGLFHGYAYGESIFGAEQTPLAAYLLGLVIIQTLVATGVAVAVRRLGANPGALQTRLAGAVVIGIGIAVLAAQLIPAPPTG
jgi:urease accessory protein